MSKLIDLVGKTFGRLTVVSRAENSFDNSARWVCTCSCGGNTVTATRNLRNGHTKSCGCLRKEACARTKTTHGCTRTSLYTTYMGMVARCGDKRNPSFHHYGGRGITVCPRWQTSFQSFRDDLGDKPTSGHTLERQNNNKGYCPCNVYWATRTAQANNRRSNVPITYSGRTLLADAWAEKTGIPSKTIRARINHGWTAERALTTPTVGKGAKLTFRGRTMTINGWSAELGISRGTIYCRIARGWDVERTVTTPPRRRR